MTKLSHKYKPGAPKIVLIILGAALWAFASYRILKLGVAMIERHALNQWLNYLIGLAGFFPIFPARFPESQPAVCEPHYSS
jgi:hypothetical protein